MIWNGQEGNFQAILSWSSADTYCSTSSYALYDDWRLPTLRELQIYDNYLQTLSLNLSGTSGIYWIDHTSDGKDWTYNIIRLNSKNGGLKTSSKYGTIGRK